MTQTTTKRALRVVMTALGTAGDVEPLLALGLELRRHGHRPVMALSPNYAARAADLGLEFVAIGPDVVGPLNALNGTLINNPELISSLDQLRPLATPLMDALPSMFDTLCRLCREADLLVGGVGLPAARTVHDLIGIPFVAVHVICPGRWRTPNLIFQAVAALLDPFREQLGLPPVQIPLVVAGAPSPTTDSDLLTLYAISPTVLPRPADWPPHYHLAGYFFIDAGEWRPDPALEQFLAAGEPPVVISFGSMPHADPARMTELLLDAVRLAGCRAIIQQGWSGLARQQLPDGVHAAAFVPHSWLFPRAACIVHHCATGTTAATFRAGVPAVCVPHAFEHPLNAELARELGVAGPSILYPQLSAARLAAAIRHTLDTPAYHQAAVALGERIRAEQGVRRARLLIEQLVDTLGISAPDDAEPSQDDAHTSQLRDRIARRTHYLQQQRRKKEQNNKWMD